MVDATSFAPWPVHPMAPLELDRQIPKRGDQRQMEAWQRIGTYAAGLALDSAGVKGNAELLSRMDMIVAAGGGERDYAVDAAILSGLPSAADPGAYLNEHLLADLRPTLFLAQLSNLLAGNISIVHGVVGSSRTFMGEEASGTDAVRIACARIAAGQGDLFLVGGSYNAQRPDVLLHYEMGRLAVEAARSPAYGQRQAQGGGMVLGSLGCFLVIESRQHAAARGAAAIAHIAAIATDRSRRRPGEATANADAAARDDAAASRSVACGCDLRRIRRVRGNGGGSGIPAWHPPAGARHRDGVRPLAGAIVPGQPGAGGDVAVTAPAVPPAGGRGAGSADDGGTAPGAGDVLGPLARRGTGRGRGGVGGRHGTIGHRQSRPPVVVVTGTGVLTSLGNGKQDNWRELTAGHSGIRRISRFPVRGLRTTIAGTVDFVPVDEMSAPALSERLAELVIEEAVERGRHRQARRLPGPMFLALPPVEMEWPQRLALAAASGANETVTYDDLLRAAGSGKFTRYYERFLFGSVAESLAVRFGTKGSPVATSTACASGATAIQLGVEAIRRGEAEAALVIGTDASVNPESLIRFSLLSALSTRNDPPEAAARPFSKDRDGFVMAEGAGALVLESLAHARARGAKIIGVIEGCGEMADGFHRTRSSPDGKPIIACMQHALDDAGLAPDADRLHQRARHRHAGERQDGVGRRRPPCSASAPRRSRFRPTSR